MTDYIKAQISKGEAYFIEGKLKEAEKHFLDILNKQHVKDKTIYNNLGVIFFHKGELKQSLLYFQEALKIDPYFCLCIKNYFRTLKETEDVHLIIPVLKKYMERFPNDIHMGNLYYNILDNLKTINDVPIVDIKDTDLKTKAYVFKTKEILERKCFQGDDLNKPHRNIILSGMPFSGLHIFENIIKKMDNLFYSDEIIDDINFLPETYRSIRKQVLDQKQSFIYNNKKAPSHENDKFFDEDLVVVLKQNLIDLRIKTVRDNKKRDLNTLSTLVNIYGYRIIAIVRDPVYTIIEWNKPELKDLPENRVTGSNMSRKWYQFDFFTKDKIERQAQIWEFYANTFLLLKNYLKPEPFWKLPMQLIEIVMYEELTMDVDVPIKRIANMLALEPPSQIEAVDNLNQLSECQDFERIKKAVAKFCPSRVKFGYHQIPTHQISFSPNSEIFDATSNIIDFKDCLNQWQNAENLYVKKQNLI